MIASKCRRVLSAQAAQSLAAIWKQSSRGEGPERTPLATGSAVYWQPGEWHETGSEAGLVAIVVEGDALGGEPGAIGQRRLHREPRQDRRSARYLIAIG